MKRSRVITLKLFAALAGLMAAATAFAAPKPVVLELFTSNSCSSCPPAISLMRKLQASPPERNVKLVLLSQHVTYWNDLGWVDRYSDKQYTQRQRDYAHRVFNTGRVYTPQLIVNGQKDMVGSRAGEVRSAIRSAVGQADLPVALKIRPRGDRSLDVSVSIDGNPDETSQVWLALTQDDVVSHVGAGENGGRTLTENGIVRMLKPAGVLKAESNGSQRFNADLTLPEGADKEHVSVVAFVQQQDSRRIVGAASQPLSAVGQQYGSR